MKSNILTLDQLLERGYHVEMKNSVLYMLDRHNTLIARVIMSHKKMFPLNLHNKRTNFLQDTARDVSTFWHLLHGHLNFEALKLLEKKRMVKGLPKLIILKDCVKFVS